MELTDFLGIRVRKQGVEISLFEGGEERKMLLRHPEGEKLDGLGK